MLSHMSVVAMLDREVYVYAEVDRLIGLRSGTARRWVNGYRRGGHFYEPILRVSPRNTEWVTWGEFVETRILAEYRDKGIPTPRLRAAVDNLRKLYRLDYPLAHLSPYLVAEARELTIAVGGQPDAAKDNEARMVVRTQQLLLSAPSRSVIQYAALAEDESGEKFVVELALDPDFPEITTSPGRLSGQPTIVGRRVAVATIAGMAAAGDRPEDLAADYGLSLDQVEKAIAYAKKHNLAAA